MNFEDLTPFTPATFVTAKDGSGFVSTVLVKAALTMLPGEVAIPTEEQLFPLGDVFPEGAEPETSSLAYASDFTPGKHNAEVLLTGTAYRPADRPSGDFSVAIRVGEVTKQLIVTGEREFEHGVLSSKIIAGEPLTAVPLTFENAFGGPKFSGNPVGRGHKTNDLPFVEYPDQRLRKLGDQPPPAGFAPLAADWEPRKSMLGTYGPDYVEKNWPGFPDDFNPAYFNAAPVDQQIDGYWRGDEDIVLDNLHPQHAMFHTKLPGWRIVCLRVNEQGDAELIPLVIDTLWIQPDQEQIILLWRGETKIQTPDALEVKHLGFLVESITSPLQDAAYYQAELQKLIEERDAEFEPEDPPVPPPVASEEPAEDDNESPDKPDENETDEDDAYLEKIKAEVAAIRLKAGHPPEDPDAVPPEPPPISPEAQAEVEKIMDRLEEEDRQQEEEEAAKKWTREKVIAAVAKKTQFEDTDLSGLDLSECDFTEANFTGANLDEVNFSGALLTDAVFASCSMASVVLEAAKLDGALLDAANLQDAQAKGVSLAGASLVSADFSGAQLDGANLTGANAEETLFHSASLQRATLREANLTSAVLTEADCRRANLSNATLVGAAGDGGNFTEADFRQADLSDAIFTGGQFSKAKFDGGQLMDADFSEAQLHNASFKSANCEGMWLSSAEAEGADFSGANCVDMQLDATKAPNANFAGATITLLRGGEGADLSGCNFSGAQGADPIFELCCVDGADFTEADIPGANFCQASAVRVNFTATELTGARFDHANCTSAVFLSANLFEAVFAGVDLTEANIGQANCFGVEFLDAKIKHFNYRDANLHRTKLESWMTTNNQ